MPKTIKVRPRIFSEKYEDWQKSLVNEGYFEGIDTNEFEIILDDGKGLITIYTKDEYSKKNKGSKVKKSKRINLWVTEEFYNDIQLLHHAHSEISVSELIVDITENYIDYLKKTQFWKDLIIISEMQDRRKEEFLNYLESKNINK